jgi:HD-GYP domain-containing protein (c-di-GMP phosphodiesterase class II)
VEIIAKALKTKEKYREIMSNSYISVLSEAAPLHDIGKISMEDAILRKEGSLNTEELKSIQSHPALGAQIIDSVLAETESSDYLTTAREMAYCHHEKWDGSGYPQGLKGEEIPLSARIMALADVYDALRSERSYKEAYSAEEAKRIMLEESGRQFDPELVEVFLEHLEEIESVM